ncbi:phosphotransferase family protein [Paenibacillus flagellatus]|uniref:Aminoglycoside phosphotransferase family protein n=1 Tax=Paenibacillus flagellatus TaxID=2211139 RepID=A0A2V5KNR9_9BACL|nr:aminoglycoside phosphotransferase family protein [Paenibacillus flagellatus]PYI56950.1 aminoglycoside phosphotransferase family protein [Paenibacillus flagellatus]
MNADTIYNARLLLSPERKRWIERAVGVGAVFRDAVPLKGGISSAVHLVGVTSPAGEDDYVLRRFVNREWLRVAPDLAAHEASALRAAASGTSGVPVPTLVAFDETGEDGGDGLPSVLMTRLPGTVVLMPPADVFDDWLRGLAEALARIHTIEPYAHRWRYFSYNDAAAMQVPGWSPQPELWERAIAYAREPMPEYVERFIHHDYHPANVLWDGVAVSGVVDWVNACVGPAGIDVGHCRINLALLHGGDAADRFLNCYTASAGNAFVYDPYWDVLSVMNLMPDAPTVYAGWTELGVSGLTDALMLERLEYHLNAILERAGR